MTSSKIDNKKQVTYNNAKAVSQSTASKNSTPILSFKSSQPQVGLQVEKSLPKSNPEKTIYLQSGRKVVYSKNTDGKIVMKYYGTDGTQLNPDYFKKVEGQISISADDKSYTITKNGKKTTLQAKDPTEGAIDQNLARLNSEEKRLNKTKDEQGFIGSSWDWIKNKTGIGEGSDKAQKQIEAERKLLNQIKTGKISKKDFKELTGHEYSSENLNNFIRCKLSLTTEQINDFIEIQKINYRKIFIKNTIREEIDNNLEVTFNEYSRLITVDGTSIIVDAVNDSPREVSIENDNKIIKIKCTDTTIEKIITDKKTNIMTSLYYDNSGNIIKERKKNYKTGKEIYNKNYAEIKATKQLASEIVNDLTNTNFLGLRCIRDTLPQNLEEITSDNILGVMKEYYKLTGHILSEDIYKYTKNKDFLELLNKNFLQKMNDYTQIDDLDSFLIYTGFGKEFNEMWRNGIKDYDSFALTWENMTGRDSFEADFSKSNLKQAEKDKYLNIIRIKAFDNFTHGDFKADLCISNAQISNCYYKSNNIYDVQFGKLYEPIVIKNKTTGVERTLDLRELFRNMSTIDRLNMWSMIQSFPPETLEDLAIEASNVTAHSGNEATLKTEIAEGLYYTSDNKIIFSSSRLETCIHELGHAVDFNYKNNDNIPRTLNNDFQQIFQQEINKYETNGNMRFIKGENGNSRGKDGYYNYCTLNEQEMFAECYTLLMLGDCYSKDTILKHFPNCLKSTKKLIQEIRSLPDNLRHQK